MSQYKVLYTKADAFPKLEKEWRCLERGNDMTYYQSYDWYAMMVGMNMHRHLLYDIVFAQIVGSDGNTRMIAPLLICKKSIFGNIRGVYLFGASGFTDYCNYIYSEFDEEAVIDLFENIKTA